MNIKDLFLIITRRILPPRVYLSMRYRIVFRKRLHWRNPQAFTEKLQWMKLYDRKPEYTRLVDKVSVKDFVAKTVGPKYVIPTLGVWESAEEVDFGALPDKFVLKCNHDSGKVIVCRDKSAFDPVVSRKKLSRILSDSYYLMGMEMAYMDVPRRIMAEELLETSDGSELVDYKFFCFDGIPKFLKINFNKDVDFHANYYDLEMNLLPFGEEWPSPDPQRRFNAPDKFDEMIDVATKLSTGLPFSRIDLYNVDGRVYFGEITLYPTSGFGPFNDRNWDLKLGDMIHLPEKHA